LFTYLPADAVRKVPFMKVRCSICFIELSWDEVIARLNARGDDGQS